MSPSLSRADLGFLRVAVVSPELRVADVAFNTEVIVAALPRGCRSRQPLGPVPGAVHHGLLVRRPVLSAPAVGESPRGARTHRRGRGAGRDRGRGRSAGRAGGQAVQLRRVHRGRARVGIGGQDLTCPPPTSSTRSAGSPQAPLASGRRVALGGESVAFGRDLLFAADNCRICVIGIEICEDLWAVNPPSGDMALGRRDGAAQPLGQQRAAGQGRLSPRSGAPAIGALPGRLSLRRRGRRRIHHRYGLGRPLADRRERRHAGRDRAVSASTRRWRWPTWTCSGWSHERSQATTPSAAQPATAVLPHAALQLCPASRPLRRPDEPADPPPARAHALCARRPGAARRALPRRSSASSRSGWPSGCATPAVARW